MRISDLLKRLTDQASAALKGASEIAELEKVEAEMVQPSVEPRYSTSDSIACYLGLRSRHDADIKLQRPT